MSDMSDKFYGFIIEREKIRLRRAAGEPAPWTKDPVLQAYKFTNVKRINDRTSDMMRLFYLGNHAARDRITLLNCVVARFFGTWQFQANLGWFTTWSKEQRAYTTKMVRAETAAGRPVWTRAYIIPNCGDAKPKEEVVCDVIDQFWAMGPEHWQTDSWQRMSEYLQTIRGMGPFMAKEVMLDFIMASGWTPSDWQTWTPVGLGARRGAARVMNNGELEPMSEVKALRVCKYLHELAAHKWPDDYVTLDLTDIQFQLCEFDKYMRTIRKEGKPKNRFTPNLSR